ncbi:MAG: response regulator [Spirochaetota bacterium]|nr:response regulator [Spirochaetota bacterium]
MNLRFKSIKTRLQFWFIALAILPLIIISIYIYNSRSEAIKNREFEKLKAIMDLKVKSIDIWLNDRISNIITVKDDLYSKNIEYIINKKDRNIQDLKKFEMMRNDLKRYMNNYQFYDEISVINAQSGIVEISSDLSFEGKDRSMNAYFIKPLMSKDLYIDDIYYSKRLNKPVMVISIPMFCLERKGRHPIAIVAGKIDLKHYQDDLLLDHTGMVNTGETFIISRDGIVLSELRWDRDAMLKRRIVAEPVSLVSKGNRGIIETRDYRGEKVLAAYSYLPLTRWGFVAKQDINEVYQPIYKMMRQLIIYLIISFVFVYFISKGLANRLSRQIIHMSRVANRIRLGDLEARNDVVGEDEVADLGNIFNEMADSIKTQFEVQIGNAEIINKLLVTTGIYDFRRELLSILIKITKSDFGAYFVLEREEDKYCPFYSIGLNAEALQSFNAKILEGEFGKAIETKNVSHLKEIPKDSILKFKTFAGDYLPKEIITIPIVIQDEVLAVISLGALNRYSAQSMEIIKIGWKSINTGIANLLANEETIRLAEELNSKNSELEIQSKELNLQASLLAQQSDELRHQNIELMTQKDKIEEANRLKSVFLSNMSHELRTPLNSILALSRVLIMQTKDRLTHEEIEYLNIIDRNGKNLLYLINDILDISKIEAGKIEIKLNTFSLKAIIDSIVESLLPIADEKGIELKKDIADDLPRIESDKKRVNQILQNIIGNAIKFTDEGSVTIDASTDDENIFIKIIDTGIGISEEEIPIIFSEFSQLDSSLTGRYGGTGLGLAIAYKTAEIIGAEIKVASELHKGSTFTVILPIKWEKSIDFVMDNSSENGEIYDPVIGKRILLVEDNEVAVNQMKKILVKEGFIIDIANDGREAIEYLKYSIPDGIILDLMMPGMDGFDVLNDIRSKKSTESIPVLVLTAKDLTAEDMKKLTNNNIQQLIQKGDINKKELLFKIQQLFKNKSINDRGLDSSNNNDKDEIKNKANDKLIQRENSKYNVLIVEDNPDNMITIKAVLGKRYNILEAVDGESGLSLIYENLPDLVLLDIALPQMSGFDIINKIKSSEAARHIPVIALTAFAMSEDRKRILDAGFDDYISKPVEPEVVLRTIRKNLGE